MTCAAYAMSTFGPVTFEYHHVVLQNTNTTKQPTKPTMAGHGWREINIVCGLYVSFLWNFR